jgi:A/G-specific adenine glycosylase
MRVSSTLPPPAPGPADLLAWYDRHRRVLPWRAPPGRRPDPYRVWLSEIMLQQTTVAAVAPYFARFTARWPSLSALAAASLDDVLQEWQGLGYYARARNLHACARAVVERHGGAFPDDPAALRALPGIGAYSAAAIAAIAFGHRVAAVDGNAERVLARLYGVSEPLPAAKTRLAALAAALVPRERPGDFAQALMDLGATICTPQRPRCVLCPWRAGCAAATAGIAETLPVRPEKPARPLRHGVAFWLTRPDGAVLLRRRPERGLLGGMIEIPSTSWRDRPWSRAEAIAAAPAAAAWSPLPGVVAHGFTHFRLELTVLAGQTEAGGDGLWSPIARLGDHALPSLMKKLVRHALSALAAEDYRGMPRAAPSGRSVCAANRTGAKERR